MPQEITEAIGTELLFENDRIRVWSMSIEPGEASLVHRHTRDWLYVYVTDDNEMETRFPDGRQARADLDDGYVGYNSIGDPQHPDLTHALHNVGAKTHRQILVEFKDEPGGTDGAPQRADNGRRKDLP